MVGLDGNALNLMGQFARQARKEGWSPEEIKAVTDLCTEGDYNDLLRVLMLVCEPPEEVIEEEDEEDDDFDEED